MMDDPLVLVNFNSDMSISLPGYCSWFNKTSGFLVHVVAALSSGDIMRHIGIKSLLSSTHGLIVKLSALLLKLIVADIKSVAT